MTLKSVLMCPQGLSPRVRAPAAPPATPLAGQTYKFVPFTS